MDFGISQRPAHQQKRVRSAFTTQQIEYLEQQFKKNQYINGEERKQLAFVLNIQERAVKIWFQNRRMKVKKDRKERHINKGPQQQLNNVCAVPSANDRPTLQVKTKSVVRSDDKDTVKPKTKTILSHFFEPSVNVDDKSISFEPKAKTTVLSHLTSADVVDKPSENAKPQATSGTVSSYFFDEHSSVPSVQISTVPNTTNKKAVSELKKYYSVLTEHLTGNYNLNMKEVQNFARKNMCSKVKNSTSSSEPVPTPKTRKLSRSDGKIMKTANVRKPSYVPLMQTMYTPVHSPASIVWKPVNILPALGSHVNTYGIPPVPPNQQKKCCCNCTQSHSSSHMYGPGGVVKINNSPYHQYVLSLPFQNQGPCL